MTARLFWIISLTLLLSGMQFVSASSSGFTVTSVSLTNILHPGQNASQTQWLVQLSLNGGGQSLAGVLSNSTINYQGYTSIYPLQISGSTNPETAFYLINSANQNPIYTYSTQVQIGSVTSYIIYVSVIPAPQCNPSPTTEWDISLTQGWFGLGSPVIVSRVCIYQKEVASETQISSTPNIQFSSHFLLLANGRQENLNLSYNQQSATSSDGLVQANWIGSLVTGNAAPDGSQYVAINNQQSGSWSIQSSHTYQNWGQTNQNVQTLLTLLQYTQSNLPSACAGIKQNANNTYISDIATCLNNVAQTDFSQNNQYANNLLSSNISIGGTNPQLTSYQGQTAFSVPLNNYFVTNPVVVLRFSGSFLGVVIPLGKPKILSATSQPFYSGTNGTMSIQVENIGTSEGAFYPSLSNCNGVTMQTSPNYAVQAGQTQLINMPIYSTGINQNLTQQCTVTVTDYNGGSSDSVQVGVTITHAKLATTTISAGSGNITISTPTSSPLPAIAAVAVPLVKQLACSNVGSSIITKIGTSLISGGGGAILWIADLALGC